MPVPPYLAPLTQPGPIAFATLFALESLSRAVLMIVLPVETLRLVGTPRDVSLLYTLASCLTVVGVLLIPPLLRRLGAGIVYALGVLVLLSVPLLLATSTLAGVTAAVLFRGL